MTTQPLEQEGRWEGFREVMVMSGPIILGSLSYTVMEFADRMMVSWVDTDAIAAVGSATIWSYTLCTLFLGTVTCLSTFVGQSIGRGQPGQSGVYAWQALYIGLGAGLLALLLWPATPFLFGLMGHGENVTRLEVEYFTIRLWGYMPMAWSAAFVAFFMAINRSTITMWVALAVNLINLGLNYVLIFGHFGFPAMGVAGAAWGTVIAQVVHAAVFFVLFLAPKFHAQYNTRGAWRFDARRCREVLRIGLPSGLTFLMDVANWGIFVSFIVGYFGAVQLAANNIAISFMSLSFMPAIAINQGIAPIVGKWIGRKDYARARARAFTALRITVAYMTVMGLVFAFFGDRFIAVLFQQPEDVVALGHRLLIIAAVFQAFDAVNIVLMGALRGAGDTRWMMWVMFIGAYPIFLPAAYLLAIVYGMEAFGAWLGAAAYVVVLSGVYLMRFRGEKWRQVNIFSDEAAAEYREMSEAKHP